MNPKRAPKRAPPRTPPRAPPGAPPRTPPRARRTPGTAEGGAVQGWIRGLTTAGTVLGALVVLYGIALSVTTRTLPGLLIAVAILIVGPGEDVLQAWARRRAATPEEGEAWATIVDRATSLAFLVLLGATLFVV